MATQVQRRKGTTAQHSTFTGASAELTVDTTKNTVVVHDGVTAGGIPLAKENNATLTGAVTLSGGTANGVAYLNGSKVLTTGSALTFNGTNLGVGTASPATTIHLRSAGGGVATFQDAISSATARVGVIGTGGNLTYDSNTGGSHKFEIGGSEQMRLTSTGLGLGTSSLGGMKLVAKGATGYPATSGATQTGVLRLTGGTGLYNVLDMGVNESTDTAWMQATRANNLGTYDNLVINPYGGNVGIGTSSPAGKLHVSSSDSAPVITHESTHPSGIPIIELKGLASAQLRYNDGTNYTARIDFDQHVRLLSGTTSPIERLTVGATEAVFNDPGNDYDFRVESDTKTHAFFLEGSSGNVGIGTSLPTSNLDVYGFVDVPSSAATPITRLNNNSTNIAADTRMVFRSNQGDGLRERSMLVSSLEQTSGGNLAFWTRPNGSGILERMRIDSFGNVGIATSSPVSFAGTTNLVVGGGSGNPILTLYGGASTYSGVYFADGASGSDRYRGFFEYNHSIDSLTIGTAASTKATIDSAGNLGLGVTPSAWHPSTKAIDVSVGGAFWGSSVAFGIAAAQYGNAVYDSAGYKYKNTANATAYEQAFNGKHIWYTAPSGTSGNAISFTQAMTLDANGNLLVGKTAFSNSGQGTIIGGASTNGIGMRWTRSTGTGTETALGFYVNGGSQIGSISTTTTDTAYNTSSDYRLKDITGPITTSGAYIDSLNPVEGTWKADGSTFVGLIAHEVQEASRTNVATGVKDGEEMQGMDYSSAEIIANLIAEVKSLRQRLAAAGI